MAHDFGLLQRFGDIGRYLEQQYSSIQLEKWSWMEQSMGEAALLGG